MSSVRSTKTATVVKGYDPTPHLVSKSTKHDDKLTDPLIIGPGIWLTIHITAKKAGEGTYEKQAFVSYMKSLRESFPCLTCRSHIEEYMKTHPFDPFWSITDPTTGRDIGLFMWAWNFHNAVNRRLNKPIVDWTTAVGLFYDDNSVCSLECGH